MSPEWPRKKYPHWNEDFWQSNLLLQQTIVIPAWLHLLGHFYCPAARELPRSVETPDGIQMEETHENFATPILRRTPFKTFNKSGTFCFQRCIIVPVRRFRFIWNPINKPSAAKGDDRSYGVGRAVQGYEQLLLIRSKTQFFKKIWHSNRRGYSCFFYHV